MRNFAIMTLAALAAVSVSARAQAQQPASAPPAYGPSITLDKAMKVAAAAEAEMKKNNWFMAIAIVDPNGDLVYFRKADNTQFASTKIAIAKANTAARYRRPTEVFFNVMQKPEGAYIATLDPTLVASGGGVLIMEGGKVIGAAGCSGGTGAQDAQMCKAGAEVIK